MRWDIGNNEIMSDGGPLNVLKECGHGFCLRRVDSRKVIKDNGFWWGFNRDNWSRVHLIFDHISLLLLVRVG